MSAGPRLSTGTSSASTASIARLARVSERGGQMRTLETRSTWTHIAASNKSGMPM